MCKPFEEWPEVMSRTDVQNCLEIPRDHVHTMFRRRDFPLLVPEIRKSQTVSKYRLREYLGGRNDGKD